MWIYINSSEKKTRTGFDIFLLLLDVDILFVLLQYTQFYSSTFLVTWSVTFNNPKIEPERWVPDTKDKNDECKKIFFDGRGGEDFPVSI